MASEYSQILCPLCGKSIHTRNYDPSKFTDEIIGISFRGLGRGRGFEVIARDNLLDIDEEHPILEDLANRVAVLHDLFFEGDEVEELLDEVCDELSVEHDTLYEACRDLLSRYQDYVDEERDEDKSTVPIDLHEKNFEDDDDDFDEEEGPVEIEEPLSDLDRELLLEEEEDE